MFIKLTNASEQYAGRSVIIRKDLIQSVFQADVERDGATVTVTYVWGGEKGTWEVSETTDEVWDLLKS